MKMLEHLTDIGFTPYKPLAASSRAKLFAAIDAKPLREIETFFTNCNGGSLPKLNLRFYRLREAVDLSRHYSEFFHTFSFLPLFVHCDMESDPCCVILSGPLRGYVYWHPHDARAKLLAPSLESFARTLKTVDPSSCFPEDGNLIYPKILSKKEQKHFNLAMETTESMDAESGAFLRELALGMAAEGRGAPFVDRCVNYLRNHGIEVDNDGYQLFVGPRKAPFHVEFMEQERDRPDFEEFFVNRIKMLKLDQATI